MKLKITVCILAIVGLCGFQTMADDGPAALRARPQTSLGASAQSDKTIVESIGGFVSTERGLQCPNDSIYAQPPHGPNDPWTAGTSDTRAGYQRYDQFMIPSGEETCDVHWWGLKVFNDGTGWQACDEDPQTFLIEFYWDSAGQPGALGCSYTVTVSGVPVPGMLYAGFQLYEYHVDLDPCCPMPNGWISIVGTGTEDCWFLWMSSPVGDGTSWLVNPDGTEEMVQYDLAFCLTPAGGGPNFGACCLDHESGTLWCQEMLEEECLSLGGTFMGDGTTCGYVFSEWNHYESTPNMDIPDYPYPGVTDEIWPNESCEVGKVTVDVCIHHPRIRDLLIKIEHWGTEVILWDGACGDNDSMGVIFDDDGNAVLCGTSTVGNIDPASTGGEPLSAFFGMEVDGAWTLTVVDQAAGPDTGRPPILIHWSLHIAFLEYNPCVEPRGACCFGQYECEVLTCEECYYQGGDYMGDFTTCYPDPCPCMEEGEPYCHDEYVDNYNGGCNSDPPVFSYISCGEKVCGTGGTFLYQGLNYRDTDWYEIWVDEITEISWSAQGMSPQQIAIIQPGPAADPCLDFVVLAMAYSNECEPVTVSAIVPPGNYWLFAATNAYSGWSCPMDYVAWVDCRPAGACCFIDGSCTMLTAEECYAQHGRWQGPFVACDDAPYPCEPIGACCLYEPVGGTIWCKMLTEAECVAEPGEWWGDQTCGYPADEVHSWFASPYLEIPDNNSVGVSHTIWAYESCEVGDVDIDVVIHHTWLADLLITIEHYGVVVVLWDGACGSNDHMSVMFDDEGNAVLCTTPVMGSVTPRSANGGWLSAFDGLEVSGPWTIRVVDRAAWDTGWLYHWSAHIRFLMENPCEPYHRGACCFDDGTCEVMRWDYCADAGGDFMGDYVPCVPNPCPVSDGACCFIDGHCEMLSEDACMESGGIQWIAGAMCLPENPCPQYDYYLDTLLPPGGGTGWSGRWYYYPQGEWWNMWWPNEFSLTRQKEITTRFWIRGEAPVEVALNWSTPDWPEDPPRPPLPGDDAYIERMMLGTYLPGGPYIETCTLSFCPRWISMDARSLDPFTIWGFIDHICLPGPETAVCCLGYVCIDVDPNDPLDPYNQEQCLYEGGEYYEGVTCANDPTPCDCGGTDYRGDSNCLGDGANSYDIDHFIQAIGDPQSWIATHPCNLFCANDINCDGQVNAYDIDGFIICIGTTVCPPCGP
ncbi:MAG: hypothetical protein ABIG44_09205 [Planctomycetota bacterium]